MATQEQKTNILVQAIVNGVHDKMAPEIAKLSALLAQQTSTLNAVLARMEVLEGLGGHAEPAAKRVVKTAAATGAAATAAPAKAAAPAKKATTPAKKAAAAAAAAGAPKKMNILQYFRKMMAEDIEGARETYAPDEVKTSAIVTENKSVQNQDETKNPATYWSAVGNAIWTSLSEEQKLTVRASYDAFRENGARDDTEEPLNEE